jgi:hypothetical protein
VPTIGVAFDKGRQDDPDWKPLFKGYEPTKKWLENQGRTTIIRKPTHARRRENCGLATPSQGSIR